MKKKVRLDIFQESVLPQLQAKHADVAALQKAIDDGYEIVEVDDAGKETGIAFVVAKAASAPATKTVEGKVAEPDVKSLVAAAVKTALDAAAEEAKTKAKKPVGSAAGEKWTIPAEVKRFGSLKSFERKEVGGFSPDERAYRFGMWALAAVGRDSAKAFCRDHGIGLVIDKAAHSEGTNTTGGYLVPEEFGTDMIDLRERYGVVRRLFKIRPMSSDTRTDPRRASGLTASFAGENAAGSESNKTWDEVRLTAKKLVVLARMSSELNEDSVISVGDDLAGEISYAYTLKEDQCGLLGDGSPTYGGIVGVVTKLTNVNGVDDGGGIVLAAGNLFSEFTLANFNTVVGRIPQYADTPNACWVAHRTFYYGTMQRLELASGGVTANEVREGSRKPRPMFLGYPVEFAQVMPSADVNSQVACTFGDHSLAASFGDRRKDTIAFSDSATIGGESVFERDQIAIRGTQRFDINAHDLGTSSAAGPVVGLISASA